ncbi:MAG: hypothetical protein IJH34_17295, partial [Romboutsia sp.]|nr:hypothetical protein [Romboutsia sp.]
IADYTITDNHGEQINASTGVIVIEPINTYQTIDELIVKVTDILKDYKPDNSVTIEDLNEFINQAISNPNLVITISDNNFNKVDATQSNNGYINTIITITNNETGDTTDVNIENITISKSDKYQTLEELESLISESLIDWTPDNSTNKQDLLNYLSSIIKNPNYSINITDDTFNKVSATQNGDGYIQAVLTIIDSNSRQTTDINTGNIIISKNNKYQTASELKALIEEKINDFVASNNTIEGELLNYISSLVYNPSLSVSYDTNNEDYFKKINATYSTAGSIDAVVIINQGNISIPISLNIDKLIKQSSGSSSSKKDEQYNELSNFTNKFSLLAISRLNVINPVDTVAANNIDTLNETLVNEIIQTEDLYSIKVVEVPYIETLSDTNTKIDGNLNLLYKEEECVGVALESSSEYNADTNVYLAVNNIDVNTLRVYSYNETLNKYVESNAKLSLENNNLKFTGTGKNKYLITSESLSSNSLGVEGWNKVDSNDWAYVSNEDCKTGWIYDGTHWYHIDKNNKKMDTGWISENNTWYYLNTISDGTRGSMKTGWQKINSNWNYFNSNGSMAVNTVVDGYYIDSNGICV